VHECTPLVADAICVNSTARYSAVPGGGGAVERFGSRTEVALLQFATALVAGDYTPPLLGLT